MRQDPFFNVQRRDPDEVIKSVPVERAGLDNLGDDKAKPFKKSDGYEVTETVPDSGFRPLAADAPVQVGAVTAPHTEAVRQAGPRIIDIDGDQGGIAKETTYAPDGVHVPGAVPGESDESPLFSPMSPMAKAAADPDAEKATLACAEKKGWMPQGPQVAGGGSVLSHPDLPGHHLHVGADGKWSHLGPNQMEGGGKMHNAGTSADDLKDHLKNLHQGFAK